MSLKRVKADVEELQGKLYSDMGIYYKVDETLITRGVACIFGPPGTPYEDCPMMYEFQLPEGFPFDPPQVLFKTYDGLTRFHPNMYRDGKVCLSILHTWNGPRWASTMRISTVLVTLQSLLDSSPIRHEPGYEHGHEEVSVGYTKCVEVACIRYILDRAESHLQKRLQPNEFVQFLQFFLERLPATLDRLESRIQNRLQEHGELHFVNLPYQLQGRTGYKGLLDRVVKLKTLLASQRR